RDVFSALSAASPVAPSEEMTRQLIQNLRPHVPEPRFRSQMEAARGSTASRLAGIFSAVQPQVSSLGRRFWLASAMLYALVGAAGVWSTAQPGAGSDTLVM